MWGHKKEDVNHLPLPEGPYKTGCIDVMESYEPDGIFFRLHYPTDVVEENKTQQWVPWIQDVKYHEGFADFVNISKSIVKFALWIYTKVVYIPAIWAAPPSSKVQRMPIVVFSHGYGATRFLCSTICNELASHGILVASIEHKDGSAALTYYYESEEARDNDRKTYIPHEQITTCPTQHHYVTRNQMLKKRSEEFIRVLNFLEKMNIGQATNVIKTGLELNSFTGLIDTSCCIAMGHSFGGSTAMYTLSKDARFKLGVILDAWMFPLKEDKIDLPMPALFINSETFQIKANKEILQNYAYLPQKKIVTIMSTTHESQTDTPIVFGYWMNLLMKKIPINDALKILTSLVLDYLRKQNIDIADGEKTSDVMEKYKDRLIEDEIMCDDSRKPKKTFTMLFWL